MFRKLILLLSLVVFTNNATCAIATDDEIYVAFLSSYTPQKELSQKYSNAMNFDGAESFLMKQDSQRLKHALNTRYLASGSVIHFLAKRPASFTGKDGCIVKRDYRRIFKILCAKGFDFNLLNEDDESPLLLAVSQFNIDNVDNILRCGADVSAKNKEGANALFVALDLSKSYREEPVLLDIVDKLLDYGADIDVMNNLRQMPISLIESSIDFNTKRHGEVNDALRKKESEKLNGVEIADFSELKKECQRLQARGVKLTALLKRMKEIKLQKESVALVNCATVISVLR